MDISNKTQIEIESGKVEKSYDIEALIKIALTESVDPRYHSPALMEEAIKLTFQSKEIDQDSLSDKLKKLFRNFFSRK